MAWLRFSRRQMFMISKPLPAALVLLLCLISCTSLGGDADAAATPTIVRGVLATVAPRRSTPLPQPFANEIKRVVPTPVPTATTTGSTETAPLPTTAAPAPSPASPNLGFSGLHFAATADGPAQSEFPAGTEIVFASWDYRGLSAADKMRRIWFRDDLIWITREEKWDWDKYGSEGTVRDVTVYDNEGEGLHPATYRLQLYVNNELQVEASFVIHAE